MHASVPFPNSYWVTPNQILAGEHPTLFDPVLNRQRIQQLLQNDIRAFLDLTEPDETAELQPYLPLVREFIDPAFHDIDSYRLPIPDMRIPSLDQMQTVLDFIDSAIARKKAIYIHCWGGIGRTGTVIGCYLVRHGMTGAAAIETIAQLRQHTPDFRYPAPARDIQRYMIYNWRRGM